MRIISLICPFLKGVVLPGGQFGKEGSTSSEKHLRKQAGYEFRVCLNCCSSLYSPPFYKTTPTPYIPYYTACASYACRGTVKFFEDQLVTTCCSHPKASIWMTRSIPPSFGQAFVAFALHWDIFNKPRVTIKLNLWAVQVKSKHYGHPRDLSTGL